GAGHQNENQKNGDDEQRGERAEQRADDAADDVDRGGEIVGDGHRLRQRARSDAEGRADLVGNGLDCLGQVADDIHADELLLDLDKLGGDRLLVARHRVGELDELGRNQIDEDGKDDRGGEDGHDHGERVGDPAPAREEIDDRRQREGQKDRQYDRDQDAGGKIKQADGDGERRNRLETAPYVGGRLGNGQVFHKSAPAAKLRRDNVRRPQRLHRGASGA